MKALTSINLFYGLLNVPIKIYPIRDTKEDSLNFVSLSECCHHETGLKRYCKSCQNLLEWKTNLKGYKLSKDNYVQLSKEELSTIEHLENGLEVLLFTRSDSIDISILSKPYFIEPTANYKLYNLFNSIFAQLNIYAVVRAVLKGNEHFGVLRHNKNGLILQMIERITNVNIEVKKSQHSKEEEEQLKTLIESNVRDFDFDELKPIYVAKVREVIQQKAEGKEIKILAVERVHKEDNLLEQLKVMQIKC